MGLQYAWKKNIIFMLAYEYMDAGKARINQRGGPLQGDLKGDYKKNAIHFISANLIWKF